MVINNVIQCKLNPKIYLKIEAPKEYLWYHVSD